MTVETNSVKRGNDSTSIEVAGTDLVFRSMELETQTPTGGKIAKEAGFTGDQHPYVLQWRQDGDLEDIRPHEEADLHKGRRFIVTESCNSNRVTIDDEPHDWPADVISGAVVRKLANIPTEKSIFLEREDQPDLQVLDTDVVVINRKGVEEFKSRKMVWQILVQGVLIKTPLPEILVEDALFQAGFEDATAWIIVLKVEGQPKRQINPSDLIDLRTPGIEKIRLTPKEVNNGEVSSGPCRQFCLLPGDETYLNNLGLDWQAIIDGELRWLIISGYSVAPGYQTENVTLALLIPPLYPRAEIDMFYVYPPLYKKDGGAILNLMEQSVSGTIFQTWSRHRGAGSDWNPCNDNLVTHLALVESAIAKEVDQ